MSKKKKHLTAVSVETTSQAAIPHPKASDLLDEVEAAEYFNIDRRTLSNWRSAGKGPRFIRVGERMIRYRLSDLEDFIAGDAGKAAA